jgi:hypothetical protein
MQYGIPLLKRRTLSMPFLDPVVDYTFANTEVFGDLLNGHLLGFLECRRWDLITPTNPANDWHGVRFTLGTDMTFPIELIGDLRVES